MTYQTPLKCCSSEVAECHRDDPSTLMVPKNPHEVKTISPLEKPAEATKLAAFIVMFPQQEDKLKPKRAATNKLADFVATCSNSSVA